MLASTHKENSILSFSFLPPSFSAFFPPTLPPSLPSSVPSFLPVSLDKPRHRETEYTYQTIAPGYGVTLTKTLTKSIGKILKIISKQI